MTDKQTEVLRAWLLGQTPESEDEAVRALMEAGTAQDELARLDRASDPLVEQLRRPDPLAGMVQEGGYRKLVVAVTHLQAPVPTDPPLGNLGEYLLLRELKAGGMGALYEAEHTRLKRKVALKVIRADRGGDEMASRFEREMEAVGRLDHPNLVRATDAGRASDGRLYLVMELLQGLDVTDVVRSHGPLPVADACAILVQAARGLHQAHEQGLVHRDIKPSNLFLTREGVVKVLDLGLAKLHTGQVDPSGVTHTHQTMGTPDYMAPEQIDDSKRVDRRADIYSLGCTLYHLLAGQPPFGGPEYSSLTKKLLAHAQQTPPPLTKQRRDLPAPLLSILDRLLAKAPDRRPATAAEVANSLEPFAAGSDLARLAVPLDGARRNAAATVSYPGQGRGLSWGRVALVLAVLGLAISGGVVAMLGWYPHSMPARPKQTATTPTESKPETPAGSPVSLLETLAGYLEKRPKEDREHLRFLTLTHYSRSLPDIQRYRDALTAWAAAVNSPAPTAIDEQGAVLVVDLRRWGWPPERWRELVKAYPYGMVPPEVPPQPRELLLQIREATGEELPYLRADWFVVRGVPVPGGANRPLAITEAETHYNAPVPLGRAMFELGLDDPGRLTNAIRHSPRLAELGLNPLATGGTVPRELWEKREATSVFQQAARELGLGTPYVGF